jgi:hypothetical protein
MHYFIYIHIFNHYRFCHLNVDKIYVKHMGDIVILLHITRRETYGVLKFSLVNQQIKIYRKHF